MKLAEKDDFSAKIEYHSNDYLEVTHAYYCRRCR